MRVTNLLLVAGLSLLSASPAVCQDAPPPLPAPPPAPAINAPAPPPAPAKPADAPRPPWLMQRGNPYVIVGPNDYQGKARMVAGKVIIITRPDARAKVASVAVVIDDRPVGAASGDRMGLYGLEFDSTTLTDGTHTVKSVGADAAGKQVWFASTPIQVRNKAATPTTPAEEISQKAAQPPAAPKPAPSKPEVKVTPVSPVKTAKAAPAKVASKPLAPTKTAAKPVTKKPATAVKPLNPKPVPAAGKPAPTAALGKAYVSAKYGFAIKRPHGWAATDKTQAMKPKQAGNGWIEFSPGKNPAMVVNVRRMRLEPKSTADTFAKYNPYVTKWDRKIVLGANAFSTNTDTGNKIIHRLIVVRNGYAWMLNCVDANGKASDVGQKTFDSMVASFSLARTAAEKRAIAADRAKRERAMRNLEACAKAMRDYQAHTKAKATNKPVAKVAAKATPKVAPTAVAKTAVKTSVKTVTAPAAKTSAKPAVAPASPSKKTP